MKACPFCAEQIQDQAIKCRFCGSMLDGSHPSPSAVGAGSERLEAQETRPSGEAMRPVEIPSARVIYDGSPSYKAWFWSYVGACILSLVVVGLPWLLVLHLRRKNTRVRITERHIDTEVGVFSKKLETLQLWRVRDLDFRQSVSERIFGIATIHVFTTDVTDPELVLRGLPAERRIFERLKEVAEIARQQKVVGMVQ